VIRGQRGMSDDVVTTAHARRQRKSA
jgi:hypothetical protein